MNDDVIGYALRKQVGSITAIESNYGYIPLDDDLTKKVETLLREELEKKLNQENKSEQ